MHMHSGEEQSEKEPQCSALSMEATGGSSS